VEKRTESMQHGFASLKSRPNWLGMPTPSFTPSPAQPARPAMVSAPVSRTIPTGSGSRLSSGKITLTPAEVEAARISGLSIEDYAKSLAKYRGMRESGEYRDERSER
jgi:hypothetical protein